MHFKIKKGLTLPLSGRPDDRIEAGFQAGTVAVLGSDYVGLKPTMLVRVGDKVKCGSPLFEDKKNPGVVITSPASGEVVEINRGAKRALISVVILVKEEEYQHFFDTKDNYISDVSEADIRSILQTSGMWGAFIARPFGKIPAIDSTPHSIFVNAMDTNPLAANPEYIIKERGNDFLLGIAVLCKFGVAIHLCKRLNAQLPEIADKLVQISTFEGPHPAGLSGTHIHHIDPVDAKKTVWTIGYQEVIALGYLFLTGHLDNQRYIAVGGPFVNSPRIFHTLMGSKVSELMQSRTPEGKFRFISGSVLHGHHAVADQDYVGRYNTQISVIEEKTERNLFGWIAPGAKRFSALNVFISSIFKPKVYDISSSQNGSPRAIVPIGAFERVFPLDILPTPLIKAILVKDTDTAQELGCLELLEEDVALCTFVDPGKHDFAPVLRQNLDHIEREG